MKQSKEMEEFDKKFFNLPMRESFPCTYSDIKQFISQNFYPKSQAISKSATEEIVKNKDWMDGYREGCGAERARLLNNYKSTYQIYCNKIKVLKPFPNYYSALQKKVEILGDKIKNKNSIYKIVEIRYSKPTQDPHKDCIPNSEVEKLKNAFTSSVLSDKEWDEVIDEYFIDNPKLTSLLKK